MPSASVLGAVVVTSWDVPLPAWLSPANVILTQTTTSDAAADSRAAAPTAKAEVANPEQLLERLYRQLEAPLTNVLYRWLWDREEVRDVLQETFLRLWRMRDRTDWDRAEPLVYKIALNLAASRRRSRKLWRFVGVDQTDSTGDSRPDAATQLSRAEEEQAVRRAIEALPERQRRVLVLVTFSGLSYEQIADTLGVSPGTVASRRHAAVRKIKERLVKWEEQT